MRGFVLPCFLSSPFAYEGEFILVCECRKLLPDLRNGNKRVFPSHTLLIPQHHLPAEPLCPRCCVSFNFNVTWWLFQTCWQE